MVFSLPRDIISQRQNCVSRISANEYNHRFRKTVDEFADIVILSTEIVDQHVLQIIICAGFERSVHIGHGVGGWGQQAHNRKAIGQEMSAAFRNTIDKHGSLSIEMHRLGSTYIDFVGFYEFY